MPIRRILAPMDITKRRLLSEKKLLSEGMISAILDFLLQTRLRPYKTHYNSNPIYEKEI